MKKLPQKNLEKARNLRLDVTGFKEFLRILNCFEHSDLEEFLTWVNDGKSPHEEYTRKKGSALTDNPFLWFLTLDDDRASHLMWALMHDYEKRNLKRRKEVIGAEGMTGGFLNAVGIHLEDKEEPGSFMDHLKNI